MLDAYELRRMAAPDREHLREVSIDERRKAASLMGVEYDPIGKTIVCPICGPCAIARYPGSDIAAGAGCSPTLHDAYYSRFPVGPVRDEIETNTSGELGSNPPPARER